MNTILKKEIELIRYVRHSILDITKDLSEEQLNHVPAGMKNNLIWNIGHMIFTQQMLCYKLGGLEPNIDIPYFAQFAPETTPLDPINNEGIEKIRTAFADAFERLALDITAGKLKSYKPWSLPSGIVISNFQDAMITNAIHEGRHFGVIISLTKLAPAQRK